MSPLIVMEFLLLAVLLAFSAFFSSAETAVFSLNPMQIHRVRRTRPRVAKQIEGLLASPTNLLSCLLIGNTIVNVLASELGFLIAERFVPGRGEAIAIPSMLLVLLVFGEITPKRIAMRWPESLATLYMRPLRIMTLLLSPFRVILEGTSQLLAHHFVPHRTSLTGEELLTVVDVGHEEGVLSKEERSMVDGIIRLESLKARDVMTPRVDLVGIDLSGDPASFVDQARRQQFRYLPLYRDTLDNVECFLDVPRYLLSPDHDLKAASFPHFFVPDTAPLDSLLNTFQQQTRRVAIVIDEYGGTAGLVTRGDILDEIVESVSNEYTQSRPPVERLAEDRWLVDASVALEELNYELDLALEADGVDRLAGWIVAMAEHIPVAGETVEAQGCRATVRTMNRRRVESVEIQKLRQDPPPAEFDI